jgi:exonuclease III
MNCLDWNIRGITAPGRKNSILDLLAKTHATIVDFQETKKKTFSPSFLDSNSLNKKISWNFLPAKGTAGGILVGVDSAWFEVLSWEIKTFFVACTLKQKIDGKVWRFISVYGSPYEEGKEEFIFELHSSFIHNNVPTLIGGDFNLVHFQKDKSNGVVNQKWCDKFNNWIELWGLLEIKLSNRRFTWANNQENLIMAVMTDSFVQLILTPFFP